MLLLLAWATNYEALENGARILCPGSLVLAQLHGESRLTVVIGAISAVAIGNAGVYFAFAAFSWWLFERIAKKPRKSEKLGPVEIYGLCLLVSSSVLGILNALNFMRRVTCWDCFFPYGVPFTFFREGGFAGGGGLVWNGVLADLLVIILFGVALALVFARYAPNRPALRTTDSD